MEVDAKLKEYLRGFVEVTAMGFEEETDVLVIVKKPGAFAFSHNCTDKHSVLHLLEWTTYHVRKSDD